MGDYLRTTRECTLDSLNPVLATAVHAHMQDYEQSGLYKLVQDNGLNISGLRTDAGNAGTAFIGLGPEPAAQKLRLALKEATTAP